MFSLNNLVHISLQPFCFSGYLIGHLAQTKEGSSGCPVLKEVNNRLVVVGLHRGSTEHSMKMTNLNLATHVHAIHYTLLGKEHTLGGAYISHT